MFSSSKLAPLVIGSIVTTGFMAVIALLIWRPVAFDQSSATLLNVLLGSLAANFGIIVQYVFGSSAGSKQKDEILGSIAQQPSK